MEKGSNTPNKGKPKLTKAEKEKLKREEAEKKAEEEEQARLAAIEEEKKRKLLEKQEATERKKLENEQKKIRKTQMVQLDELLQINKTALRDMHNERRKKAKWARYLRCDGSPDPTIPWEINTYVNLKMEETSRNDADSVLHDCEMDLALITELQFMLDDTPSEDITEKEIAASKDTIEELQHLMKTKLDLASLQVLCDATNLQDNETNNLQYMISNSAICLCIWGNLSKNQRIKTYEFASKGFTFDIPRTLALTDCAFRVLFTKYDHCSPKSKAFLPRRKPKEIIVEPEEEIKEKEFTPTEEEKVEEEEVEEEEVERDNTMDLMAQLKQFGDEEVEEKVEEEEHKEEEEEVVEEDYEDRITPEPPEWMEFDEEDDVLDLRAYHVVGELFTFNLLDLPPQPKSVNKWTITTMVVPPELTYLEYKADVPPPNQTKDQKDSQTQEKDKRDEKPPIGIHIKLPVNQLFLEEPQIAWWNEDHNYWRLDGFSDIVYNEEHRTLVFKTSRFGTLALLQDAHINMPFQSWEIRPHSLNRAVLTIVAAIVEIEIEIKDSMCSLSNSTDLPELSSLKKIPMTPIDFIRSLQKVGMNIFPAEDSSKYVTVQNKHPIVEDRIYEQMALVSSSMAFSWSKWNSEVNDKEKIIFQAAEHLVDERLLEEDWSLFQATKRQVMKLKMTEFDEEYNGASAFTDYHSNMYQLVLETGSEKAVERIKSSSIEFIDCVQQLLKATRVLTFA